MKRSVAASCVVLLLLAWVAPSAWAEPAPAPTLFGFGGVREAAPPAPADVAGPAPAAEEVASFGAAGPCRPAWRFVRVSACDPYRSYGTCAPCDPCDPCATCPAPCPTQRVAEDPLSVATVYWPSGYHDGGEVRRCDPCVPCVSRPVYRPPCAPCDPCARPCRVVRRCVSPCWAPCPTPCYTPCATRCYSPCYAPCRSWCGPRLRVAVAPWWGWGIGWGWGGCW